MINDLKKVRLKKLLQWQIKGVFVESLVKNLPAYVADVGLIPGLGRSPGEENGNPPQYSCLENPMDRKAWQAMIHRVTESDRT